MAIDSDAIVEFHNVPWDSGYANIRWFGSASSRDNWFASRAKNDATYPLNDSSHAVVKVENASPVRLGKGYVVSENWDKWHNFNYLRFKNREYAEGEWVYCFITGWEYIGAHAAKVYFVRDAYTNSVGKINIKPCFVERMHTSGDAVTYEPEPFSINRYITKFNKGLFTDSSNLVYFLIATGHWSADPPVKVDNACTIDSVPYDLYMWATTSFSEIQDMADEYNQKGTTDRIVGVFGISETYCSVNGNHSISFKGQSPVTVKRNNGSYSPKNKKCLQYPYCHCLVSDGASTSRVYKWEDGDGSLSFNIQGATGMSGVIMLQPSFTSVDLETVENMSQSITVPVGYSGSGWANWLAQNQASIRAQENSQLINTATAVAGGIVSAGVGLATGGVGGAVLGAGALAMGVSQVSNYANTANSINAQKEGGHFAPTPCQVPTGGMMFLAKNNLQGWRAYSVYPSKSEFQSLDDFFTRFGYAYNRIHSITPTRSSFTYFKTAGCTVTGAVPCEDRQQIMQAFDRGVTLWTTDDVGNYSLSNS